ncbi:MAG: hypothetical protein VB979_11460 [Acinetobacter sp.]|uniref:hypothetical protein n=1 Tax=Acinetobacter sp. TaxID=472 RepID=UPI0039820ED2
MNNFKGLEDKFKKIEPQHTSVEGHWTQIRWMPDLISNEQISIGVFLEENGFIHTKYIENYERLECVYGSEIANNLELAIDLIEYLLKREWRKSVSPQLIFDQRGFARGESSQAILDKLFNRAVPFGKPHDTQNEQTDRFPTYRTSNLITNIKSRIFNQIGNDVYNIFPEESWLNIKIGQDTHQIDLPIRPKGTRQVGNINSTIYKTYDKFEVNCLTALTDLQLAKKCGLGDEAILFTLLPNDYSLSLLPEQEQEKRSKFLKEFEWKLEMNDIEHLKYHEESDISENILSWAKKSNPTPGLFN